METDHCGVALDQQAVPDIDWFRARQLETDRFQIREVVSHGPPSLAAWDWPPLARALARTRRTFAKLCLARWSDAMRPLSSPPGFSCSQSFSGGP
jgi:hypothetical protein